MTMQNPTLRDRQTRGAALAVFGLALAAIALPAAPAQARDEFENGFEDQIGRLLAFEAYRVGRVVLGAGVPYAGYRGDYYDYDRPRHEHHHYYPPPRHYYRPKFIQPHHRHRGHDRDCDEVEYRYEVRRSRHGEEAREHYRSRDRDDRYDEHGYWRDRRSGWRY